MRVHVVTDSTASLPAELARQHAITVVPYYVHMLYKSLRDGIDIDCATLCEHLCGLAVDDVLPTTANPSPGAYEMAYRSAGADGAEILSFHMTSSGSGAYGAAMVAAKRVAQEGIRVHCVDTRNVSMCHGWITPQAARLAEQGAKLNDILASVKGLVANCRMLQTSETLRYLYMGGRIGRASHLVSSLLRIKPIVSMAKGVISPVGLARSWQGVLKRIAQLTHDAAGRGSLLVAVTHAAAQERAQTLAELVRPDAQELLITELSPALAVHAGPGTVGLCYALLP